MSTRTASLIISVTYFLAVVHAPSHVPNNPCPSSPCFYSFTEFTLQHPQYVTNFHDMSLRWVNLQECQALEQLCMDFGWGLSLNYCGRYLTVTDSVILVALRM